MCSTSAHGSTRCAPAASAVATLRRTPHPESAPPDARACATQATVHISASKSARFGHALDDYGRTVLIGVRDPDVLTVAVQLPINVLSPKPILKIFFEDARVWALSYALDVSRVITAVWS